MIPILLLDLAGVLLVAGYVLVDRRQHAANHLPTADHAEQSIAAPWSRDPTAGLPIEPIVAQRPNPGNLEPRRIRRPNDRGRADGGRPVT